MNFNYSIRLNKDNEWSMEKHHFHDEVEILFSLSDAGSFFADGNLYPLNRGSLIILPNTMLHKTIASDCKNYARYVVHFSKKILDKISTSQTDLKSLLSDQVHFIQVISERTEELILLFEKCMSSESLEFGDDIRRDIAFLELLLELCNYLNNNNDVAFSDDSNFVKIAPILDYIDKNLTSKLSLQLLAEEFYMNKFYLSRLFKTATGFTLMDYIINCRILKAKQLLREGLSVQQAGELSGFNNNAHFIRTFGKYTNLSPGKYMKKYRES